jgi:hypothetical protein
LIIPLLKADRWHALIFVNPSVDNVLTIAPGVESVVVLTAGFVFDVERVVVDVV